MTLAEFEQGSPIRHGSPRKAGLVRSHTVKRRHSTDAMRRARPLLIARADSRCERCGAPFSVLDDGDPIAHAHHRKARSQGGSDELVNLVFVSPTCHSWIHGHPIEAKDSGWIVLRGQDPAATPVMIAGRRCLLDADGGMQVVEEAA